MTDFGKEMSKFCARSQDIPNDILEQRGHSDVGSLDQKETILLEI